MKKIILLLLVSSFFSSDLLMAQAGSLDPGFSGDGKLVFDISPPSGSIGYSVAVQADGKIVIGGVGTPPGGSTDFALTRLTPDGAFDTSFGDDNGLLLTNLGFSSERIHNLVIQPDGKIVASGTSKTFLPYAEVFATVRYNSDGSLDHTFGNQGVTKTTLDDSAYPSSMALQADGKIVVSGDVYTDSIWQIGLIRLKTDGTLDSTFNQDGIMIHNLGSYGSFVRVISIQPDGKIVATGYKSNQSTGSEINFITRYLPNGSLDSSFAINGVLIDKFAANPSYSKSFAMALQQDGKIVIGGASAVNWPLARYNSNGTIDLTFDFDGKITTQIPQRKGWITELAIQPDGKIIAVGVTKPSPTSDDSTLITVGRYLPNGALDNTFGVGGIKVTPQLEYDYDDLARGMAIQSDGKIIVVGSTEKNYEYKTGIARYLTNLGVGIINNSSNVLCFGGNNGSATAEPFGGTTPYTYLWSNGQTTKTATGLSAGTYTVKVTGSGSSGTVTASVTITQPPALTVAASVSGMLTCLQTSVTATASVGGGKPGYIILWENGESGPTVTFSAPGTYQVTVTDANSCSKTSSVTVVNGDLTAPTAVVAPGGTLTCLTTQLALSGSGSSQGGTYSYNWTSVDGQIVSGENTLSPIVNHCGDYTLIVTKSSNGCTASASTTVICNNDLPTVSIAAPDNLNCNNSTVELDAIASSQGADFNYLWTSNDGHIQSGETTLTPIVGAAGNYTFKVTNTDNGCTSTASITVIQHAAVQSSISSNMNVSCHGGSNGAATVVANGGNGNYSYVWSNGAMNSAITNLSAGVYLITITDGEGCAGTSSITITQPELLLANTTATSETSFGASNGTASASPTGGTPGYTYAWSNGPSTATITDLAPGSYTVTVHDSNDCSVVQTVNVTTYNCAISASVTAANINCFGNSSGTASIAVSGGQLPYTYVWSNGATSATINNLVAGTYTVIATDNAGCASTGSIELTQPQPLIAIVENIQHVLCPNDLNGAATINTSGGTAPYNYSVDLNNLGAGNYSVSVSDANGCSTVVSFSILTTDTEAPVIVCPSGIFVCGAGIVDYPAPATSDNCSGNIFTSMISGLPSGSHFEENATVQTFLATDASGNSSTCAFTVVVNPTPELVLDGVVNDQNGQGSGSISVTVSGSSGSLTYSWAKNGQLFSDQEDLDSLTAGVYSLVVTDANGCSVALDSVQVLNTVGIDEPSESISLKLFPNPCTSAFHLEVSGAKVTDARICNIQGQQLYVLQPLEWQEAVDIDRLSNGIYYLRLFMESGQAFTLKFVKSK